MRASLKILPVVAVTLSGVALSGVPAGAQPASAPAFVTLAVVPAQVAIPNSNIVKSKTAAGTYQFKPKALAATWNGPPPIKTCTKGIEKVTITNKSGEAQTLTSKSGVIGTLPNKEVAGLCFWGTAKKYVFKFGLEGQKSTLKVTVT
jgi:hypothetical protein